MNCKDYYNVRKDFKDGDIILYRGSSFLSKSIQYFDSAYYNHVGVVKLIGDRLFTIDMWTHGIEIVPLSRRMKGYQEFCVVRVKDKEQDELIYSIDSIIEKIERDTKYDYLLLPRIAFYKKTKIDLVGIGNRNRFICSELVQYFTNTLNVECYKDIELITPQDFLRESNIIEIEILYDLSPKI
jgi:hypothetical protein